MVARFCRAIGNENHEINHPGNLQRILRAANLIREEAEEFDEAVRLIIGMHASGPHVTASEIHHLIKELADLQYVVSAFAVEFGIDLDEAFKEVHRSNMTKLDEDGNPLEVSPRGKIKKGPRYVPADMRFVQYCGDECDNGESR